MRLPSIREVRRLRAPLPEPQALAWDGNALWLSSRVTHDVYRFDAAAASAQETHRAPGTPYGITYDGRALRVLCGEGAEDDRYVRRFVTGAGFESDRIPCPELTGSYLAWDGTTLFVTQWYRQRVLALDADGNVQRDIAAPRQLCGCTFVDGDLFLMTTEDEETDEYFLMRVRFDRAQPSFEDVARVPLKARSLAWDGQTFWTNHRERHEIVAFEA